MDRNSHRPPQQTTSLFDHLVGACEQRCIGRDWHKADNSAARAFVRYWSNSGRSLKLALN
jgi:hypothetical protein